MPVCRVYHSHLRCQWQRPVADASAAIPDLETASAANERVADLPARLLGERSEPSGAGLVRVETSPTGRTVYTVRASDLAQLNHRRRCSRMARALISCADLTQREWQRRAARFRVAFVTLTYRPTSPWDRRHVSTYLDCCRSWLGRRGVALTYEWKAELTQRGAVHYHLLLWLPRGLSLPMADKAGWWRHGFSNMVWARKPVGYIAKYIRKDQAQRFPKGLRIHGRGGQSQEVRQAVRFELLPTYVREHFGEGDIVRRSGGGWWNRDTGECLAACAFRIDWSS